MNYYDLNHLVTSPLFKNFAKNEWIRLDNEAGRIGMNIQFSAIPTIFKTNIFLMKDDHNAIGYVYILNELYNNGIKVVKPTYEQCLSFENIELSIPFKEYTQPYETMLVEYPEEYVNLLRSRYKQKPPIACICHKPSDKEYMIGGLAFGIEEYNITFFITNYEAIIEELIVSTHENVDPDFLPAKQAERVALNIMLFMTNFGTKKIGYSNVKQHRFYERKRPEEAKRDFFYYGLNQEIKLFERKSYKEAGGNGEGHHGPVSPHWRRGYWRLQHYGPANSLTKTIFIKAVFVCSEQYRGDMSDTSVTYK